MHDWSASNLAPPAGTETMGFEGGEAINNAGQVALNTQTNGSLAAFRAFLDPITAR